MLLSIRTARLIVSRSAFSAWHSRSGSCCYVSPGSLEVCSLNNGQCWLVVVACNWEMRIGGKLGFKHYRSFCRPLASIRYCRRYTISRRTEPLRKLRRIPIFVCCPTFPYKHRVQHLYISLIRVSPPRCHIAD